MYAVQVTSVDKNSAIVIIISRNEYLQGDLFKTVEHMT